MTLRALTSDTDSADKSDVIDPSRLEPLVLRKHQIAKRLGDLDNRAARIAREREDLKSEAENIEITLRTLAQFGLVPDDAPDLKGGKVTGGVSTKPDDTPTLFEMVTSLLDEWSIIDDKHEANEIFEHIKRRWWPDAPRNSIIPSLWRFAQEGRLTKEGTKYGLPPKEETPGGETPGASMEVEDVDDDEIPF